VQGIGGEGRRSMKKKIKYSDEPLGKLRVIDDFLPPPEELVFKEENVKVTMTLSKFRNVFRDCENLDEKRRSLSLTAKV